MINDKDNLIADGIKMLIEKQMFEPSKKEEWLKRYGEVFPKQEPFGGPY